MRHTQQTTSRLTTNLINSEQPSSAGDETAYQRSLCYDGIMYMYVMCCGVSMCVLICAQEFKYPPHTHTYTSMRIEYYSYKRIHTQYCSSIV
mmetsp:Transcript_18467/g.26833  ORF Transcript_18467/g.26833 Transcript_18467/m.26833 type:complete len:92 (-) Transcript_18467:386-661(-)